VKVALTNGAWAIVDEADFPLIAQYRWYEMRQKYNTYAATDIDGETVYMHRLILGAKPGQYVVHADRNGLNNSRENLRLATTQQKNARRHWPPAASGFRGVHRNGHKYRAQVSVNKRNWRSPSYRTPEEAARAYDAMARKAWGSFALTNEELGLLPGGK
jgi:hypothetical protein